AARRHGRALPAAEEPGLPPEAEYLWRWFLDLHGARASSGFGPQPLSYGEIAAYAALHGLAPTPWEVGVLRDLDREYLKHAAEQAARETLR
ncbi:MAG: hypothetical protein LDL44_13685, partial [Caenispirillum sp.]|nr:hypothetical protein [Caenispirillum sp.]